MQCIDSIIEEKSLLKHRFYQMWSDGKLDRQMLAGYSMEYYQLVKAVPLLMESILHHEPCNDALKSNMQEEYEHIPLWEEFAAGLGVDRSELVSHEGLPETRQAIQELYDAMDGYRTGAAAMYALEKEIPNFLTSPIRTQ